MGSGRLVRRLLALSAAGVIVAAGIASLFRLSLDEDLTTVFPEGDPSVADFRFVVSNFRIMDTLYIDVGPEGDSEADGKAVVALADALSRELEANEVFGEVHYRFSGEGFLELADVVPRARARLVDEAALARFERMLSPSEVLTRLESARRALGSPEGIFLKEGIRSDPLNIGQAIFEKWRAAGDSRGIQVRDGRLWSADGRHTMIVTRPDLPSTESAASAELVVAFESAVERALAAVEGAGVTISWTGGHRASSENSATIKSDASRAIIAATAAIAVLGIFFFKRAWWTVLVFVPTAVGTAAALWIMGLGARGVSAMEVGCAAALVGITVDYGIHILYGYQSGAARGISLRQHLRSVRLPLVAGGVTTIAALLSLTSSSLVIIRQVGVFASISVGFAVLFALLGLPELVGAPGALRRKRVFDLRRFCERLLEWRTRHAWVAWALAGGILAVSLAGVAVFEFDADPYNLSFSSPAHREDELVVKRVWGDLSSTLAAVKGESLHEALEENDKLSGALAALQTQGKVASFSSISDILPSQAKQEANKRRWRTFWSQERIASVREMLAGASAKTGFSEHAFDPFLNGLTAESPPIGREDFAGSGLDRLLDSRISETDGRYAVLTTLRATDPASLVDIEQAIKEAVPGAVVFDSRRFGRHMVQVVGSQLGRLVVVACAAVTLCLLVIFGRAEIALLCAAPALLSILTTLGVTGIVGVKINVISCLFVAFVFGVGLDYGIFFANDALRAYQGRGGDRAGVLSAVLMCAFTTMCGFLAMTLARHPALFSIGLTGSIGMASSVLWAWILVPVVAGRLLPEGGRTSSPTLVRILGAVGVCLFCAVWWLAYVLALRPVVTVLWRKDELRRQRFARKYIQLVSSGVMRYFPYGSSVVRYVGAEPETFARPAVIASNHLAAVDIMYLLSLPVDMVMLVKEWVLKAPVVGMFARDAGYLCVRRDGFEDMLEAASRHLAGGTSVTIFPEGSRSPDAYMRRFHKGAFEIATRTGADVLPVLLTNTQVCTPKGFFWVGPHNMSLRVQGRVTPADFDYSKGARALGAHVKEILKSRQADDWRDTQSGRTFFLNIRNLYGFSSPYVESYIAWKLRLDPIYRKVDSLVSESARVFDLGCGYGLMSNILARKSMGRTIRGVDFDEAKIAVARGTRLETQNTRFEKADFLTMQFPKADAVLMVDILHYWEPGKQIDIIRRAAECLAPGGTVVFRDALESPGWRHKITALLERFSTGSGCNRKGDGLHFMDRRFYEEAFGQCNLAIRDEVDAGRGSNVTLLLEKCVNAL